MKVKDAFKVLAACCIAYSAVDASAEDLVFKIGSAASLAHYIDQNNQANKNKPKPDVSYTLILSEGSYDMASLQVEGLLTIRGGGTARTIIRGACAKLSKRILPGGLERYDDKERPNAGFFSREGPTYEMCSAPPDSQSVFVVAKKGSLVLSDLTIRDGQSGQGGGISNKGTLDISRTTITHNHAHGEGGGIYNLGTLKIRYSTISQNVAHEQDGAGGGIFNGDGATLYIAYSTINGNFGRCAGGIYNGGEIYKGYDLGGGGPLTIVNSTISNNKANIADSDQTYCTNSAGGILSLSRYDTWLKNVTIAANADLNPNGSKETGGTGGVRAGVRVGDTSPTGRLYLVNSIITGNLSQAYIRVLSDNAKMEGIDSDCHGSVYTLGGNLMNLMDHQSHCEVTPPAPWPSTWPSPRKDDVQFVTTDSNHAIYELWDNGYHTCTHQLNRFSPAIGKGWTGVAVPAAWPFVLEGYDQRMVLRGGYSDIGAYALDRTHKPQYLEKFWVSTDAKGKEEKHGLSGGLNGVGQGCVGP